MLHVILEVGSHVSMLLVAMEVFHALHIIKAFAVELAYAHADIIFCMLVSCAHCLGGDASFGAAQGAESCICLDERGFSACRVIMQMRQGHDGRRLGGR